MENENIIIPSEYADICPIQDKDFHNEMSILVNEPMFKQIAQIVMPQYNYTQLKMLLLSLNSKYDLQTKVMKPFIDGLLAKTSKGLTASGLENLVKDVPNTFITNHRDIVLDSAFLSMLLVDNGFPTTVEIAIGDNLLIFPWIKKLVRINKSFIVQRSLSMREMLRASQTLSRYMHFAIFEKQENIWIAQREGRAKDSNDRTQEALLKMMVMGGEGSVIDRLRHLHLVPMALSYEYDPCDYLKAQEFQQKRDNPAFKKSRQDDLDNMKTGIFGYKGRVHYHCGIPVNTWMGELENLPKKDFFAALAKRMDQGIHQHYRLFPCNYIALDELNGNSDHADSYTEADKKRFEDYLASQMAKIKLPNKDEAFLRERMLTMYANPAINKLKVKG